ncbi:hypothetical protein [Streptomyces sp. NPDC008240]|uniref:hypothetical protein n=1 Tax=Streptomyces sp. NPDC008240 TaxID=3364822 RepID=UPI0036EC0B64
MKIAQWMTGLDLSADEKKALGRALGIDEPTEEKIEKLTQIALTEYIEWLIGKRRLNTISEIDAYRTFRLFSGIREEPISIESIANDLSFSPGKAISIVSRLRYGEGRALARLANASAIRTINAANLKSAERVTIYLDGAEYDAVMYAAGEIMRDTTKHAKGKKWEGCERPDGEKEKYLSRIKAAPKMWRYIVEKLSESS